MAKFERQILLKNGEVGALRFEALLLLIGGPSPYLWVGDTAGNCFGFIEGEALADLSQGIDDAISRARRKTLGVPRKNKKRKREAPLRIPLSFEKAVEGLVQVDPRAAGAK